ncbi:MAG: NMD3-related protein [Thermofilaceae archaeon]
MDKKMGSRICPICGKPADAFFNGLCEECYKRANPLLKIPEPVEVTICKLCGAYKAKGKWILSKEDNPIAQALRAALYNCIESRGLIKELRIECITENMALVVASGSAEQGMKCYDEKYEFTYRIHWSLCDACINAKSKKEVARIQIRAKGRLLASDEVRRLKSVVDKALNSTQRGCIDLFDIIESKGTIDFLFSSLSTAKIVLKSIEREFPVTILETRKNAGIDPSGKLRAKVTYRVMLPEFRIGDVVNYHGKDYYVLGLSNKLVKTISLEKMEEENLRVSKSLIEESRVICRKEEGEIVLVFLIGEKEVQTISLANNRVYSIPTVKKSPWIKEGSHAVLFRIDDYFLLVPLL